MKIVLFLILLILLFTIVVQDFKYRAVSWIVFPLICISGIIYSSFSTGIKETIIQSFFSILFVAMQWLLLSIYLSVKNKKVVSVTKEALGWGDILFWLFLSVTMPFINFIIYFSVSLVLVVAWTIFIRVIKQNNSSLIPLAGMQAVFFIPLLMADIFGQLTFWEYWMSF